MRERRHTFTIELSLSIKCCRTNKTMATQIKSSNSKSSDADKMASHKIKTFSKTNSRVHMRRTWKREGGRGGGGGEREGEEKEVNTCDMFENDEKEKDYK